jgi:hypothetical protein
MNSISTILTLLALFVLLPVARGQDARQTYVGGSGCKDAFRRGLDISEARLDKSQRAYLKVYTLDGRKTLLIVQYEDGHDQCGIVRDLVQMKDKHTALVWNCTNPKAPKDVVVGTWPTRHPSASGRALEAWRIDLRQLRFSTVSEPVVCVSGPGAGADTGGDLSDMAKARPPKTH